MNILNIINSNGFQTVVSFVIGLFIFVIYRLQKANDKESIAKIIIIDILDAERDINEYRTNEFNNLSNMQQKNSRFINRHLFVNDFSDEEFSYINNFFDFYNKFSMEIDVNCSMRSMAFKARSNKIHEFTMDIILKQFEENDYDINKIENCRPQIHDLIIKAEEIYFGDDNIRTYDPSGPKSNINKSLPTLRSIVGSTIFDKFKYISSKNFINKVF